LFNLSEAKTIEIRCAGFGGQGIIRCGYIIGRAAVIYGNKSAVQTQTYGPESRGGACSTGIIIKTGFIDYPLVRYPKIMIIMSQEAYNTYHHQLAKGGIIIADKDLVVPKGSDQKIILVPATRMAEKLGRKVVANTILLGVFTALTKILDESAMRKSIADSVPPATVDLNLKAFDMGLNYIHKSGLFWKESDGSLKKLKTGKKTGRKTTTKKAPIKTRSKSQKTEKK